jgi:hypothetical protein
MYFMTRNLLLWGERHLERRRLPRLFGSVLGELKRRLLPESGIDTMAQLRAHWREPQIRAMAWGIWHYVIRRFGDAPEHVRRLARPS